MRSTRSSTPRKARATSANGNGSISADPDEPDPGEPSPPIDWEQLERSLHERVELVPA
jgi:hypothetical protein